MATKSQLKQYFETGKIPTQAQFGELINSFIIMKLHYVFYQMYEYKKKVFKI